MRIEQSTTVLKRLIRSRLGVSYWQSQSAERYWSALLAARIRVSPQHKTHVTVHFYEMCAATVRYLSVIYG